MEKKYIKRRIDNELLFWAKEDDRKPLLLRGARQVGKSSSVRKLGETFENFVEVNFEKNANIHSFFDGDLIPQEICAKIAIHFRKQITAGKTLLFLDEIQACPRAISALRFFYEDYPELHVVAAGSLLEFALRELPSFGVGRIDSMFMYPFSFAEFAVACGEEMLWNEVCRSSPEKPLFPAFHEKMTELLKKFLVIGGMPAVVAKYLEKQDIQACQKTLDTLITSLKSDFTKYKKRVPELQISTVFDRITEQAGKNFTYSGAGQDFSRYQIRQALELLKMAGLVIPVTHTSANGLPLGAEINPAKQKMLMIDTGILQHLLGLPLSDILFQNDLSLVNKGGVAEIYVGLELLKNASCYVQQALYYWRREAKNSNAEVDFVVQLGEKIVPIEVKSGSSGKMQSMWQFLKEKQSKYGIRTSLENFGQYDKIKVMPLYAVGNILKT
jgi:predicted AAA+ superfamily ATPase